MKNLIGFVLFVLAGVVLVTPCCLPNQFSFTYTLDIKSAAEMNGKVYTGGSVLRGSGAVDFQTQEFSATLPKSALYMLLSLKQGFYEERKHKWCVNSTTSGEAGRDWQCAIDNPTFATKAGSGTYEVDIPQVLQGEVKVTEDADACLPVSAKVTYYRDLGPRYNETTKAVLTVTATPGIPDRSVFDRPCEGKPIAVRYERDELEVVSPEQLIKTTLEKLSKSRSGEDEG